ncbi:MAG: alpha/beta hydrolase [Acidimicrobiia bacterium]
MAPGPRRGIVGLLVVLVLAGCTGEATDDTARTVVATTVLPPSITTSSTSTSTTTTSTTSSTTTTTLATTTTTIPDDAIDAEIGIPEGDGPFPAVVLAHGGGWVGGDPSIMRPLARFLNDNGFLTVNTRYALSTVNRAGFPAAVEDVACAVRVAAALPESDGTVAIIGHSAGAHIGAIVALTGDQYTGDCPVAGSGRPERFVGLAGPYDISRIGFAMSIFFGGPEVDHPEAWRAGNPQLLTDENPDLDALIMYGELDGLVDSFFAFDFAGALEDSGATALLELVEGARHNDMHDPGLVGDLIVTWLER